MGYPAEERVLRIVREYFPEASIARGSGNVHHDGDIIGVPGVFLEVKERLRGRGFSVTAAEVRKTKQQAAEKFKSWALAVQNKTDKPMVVCDLDFLLTLLSYVPPGDIDWEQT